MNANRLFLRPWLLSLASILAAVGVRAEDAAPKPDANLEIIQYRTPSGWKVEEQAQAARTFTAPDSNAAQQAVIIMMLSPAKDGLELRAEFDSTVKKMSSNGKVAESSDVDSLKTRQGFEALAQTLVTEGEGTQRVYLRIVAAKVQNRMAGFCYLATNEALYDAHQPDMDALLKSVNFNVAAVAAGNPLAAKAEIAQLEKQKQEFLKKVAEIEVRQRQLAAAAEPAGAAGAGTGSGITAVAAAQERERKLAAAIETFKKEMPNRRKAHKVLGDILTLDGKTIADVVQYQVVVVGTTRAAERTHYTIDVDEKGHFEQEIPDGIYHVNVECTIKYAGHRVHVGELADLAGTRWSDQSSADGIVKDFRLMLSGLKPGATPEDDRSYYGNGIGLRVPTVQFRAGFADRFPGSTMEILLTPEGKLLDGSEGGPITLSYPIKDTYYPKMPRDIPVGVYRTSVSILKQDGSRMALGCSLSSDDKNCYSWVQLYWGEENKMSPQLVVQEMASDK